MMRRAIYQNGIWTTKLLRKYNAGFYLIILIFLSFIERRIILNLHLRNFQELIDAAYGVLNGRPHWITFQNRLLGSYVIQLISATTGRSFGTSFSLFLSISLVFANIILFFIFSDLTKNRKLGLKYTFYFVIIFLLLQHEWLFPWDLIDILIFSLFAYSIYRDAKIRYFVILFIIALLNRESALFISLWIIIDSFKYIKSEKTFCRLIVKKYQLIAGILLTIAGMIYTKGIRDYLFIDSAIRIGSKDKGPFSFGNQFHLFYNVKLIYHGFFHYNGVILTMGCIIGATYYLLSNIKKFTERTVKVSLLLISVLFSIITFTIFTESRGYFILIPFILMFDIEFKNRMV